MTVSNLLDDFNGYPDACLNGTAGSMPVAPYGGGNGCGFGSWIWILLILFYSSGFAGNCCGCGNNCGCGCGNNCGCGCGNNCGCGCGNNCGCGNANNASNSCSQYLFLLVILFLCNSNCGGCGYGFDNGFFGGGCGC